MEEELNLLSQLFKQSVAGFFFVNFNSCGSLDHSEAKKRNDLPFRYLSAVYKWVGLLYFKLPTRKLTITQICYFSLATCHQDAQQQQKPIRRMVKILFRKIFLRSKVFLQVLNY